MSDLKYKQLRKTIVGELSRVQLYAKDHPYDVTAGDEEGVERAAGEIMQAFDTFHEEDVERARREAQEQKMVDYFNTLEATDAMQLLGIIAYLYVMEPTNATSFKTKLHDFNQKGKVLGDLKVSAELVNIPKDSHSTQRSES